MIWNCNFTIQHYKEVLEYAKKKYVFQTFSEYDNSPKQSHVILLRHDIDYSIEKAFEMAKLESDLEIKSTYFVLLHGLFYNPYSSTNTIHLKKIIELGHEIGLHYDSTELSKEKFPYKKLKEEIKQLEQIIDNKVLVVAQHNPTVSPKLRKISKEFLDARESKIFQTVPYISDSVKNWRSGCMCNHIGKQKTLQILVHPIWWTKKPKTIEKILDEIGGYWTTRINKVKKMYVKYLKDLESD